MNKIGILFFALSTMGIGTLSAQTADSTQIRLITRKKNIYGPIVWNWHTDLIRLGKMVREKQMIRFI